MDNNKIREVLELHIKWLSGEKEGVKANLSEADLKGVNFSGVNLYGANLAGANLSGANLSEANLIVANLSEANLSEANLSGANLYGANLAGAIISEAKVSELAQALTIITPEGCLKGWKKCRDNVLVKLEIPEDSLRSNSVGRKCRAEFVRVLEVIGATEGISLYTAKTVYRVGDTVKCDKWNEDRSVECGGGIHFFLTRIEAESYIG